MSEWISVDDRLPDKDALYLVHCSSADPDKPLLCTAWFDPSGFGWSQIPQVWIDVITHWMPLPPPPLNNRQSGPGAKKE